MSVLMLKTNNNVKQHEKNPIRLHSVCTKVQRREHKLCLAGWKVQFPNKNRKTFPELSESLSNSCRMNLSYIYTQQFRLTLEEGCINLIPCLARVLDIHVLFNCISTTPVSLPIRIIVLQMLFISS